MASMTTATTTDVNSDCPPPPPLRLDSIPTVDLRLLSQSELYSLSLCSDSAYDLHRCDDVVIPKIDRSVFNESAGSRKQTYSRLRLAPAESSSATTTIHRRTPHLRLSHTPPANNINDPEQAENSQIIRMLKQLFKADPNFDDVVPIEVEDDSNNPVVPESLNPEPENVNVVLKRKRGRPRKHENTVFLRPPSAKRIRNSTVKKVVVFDTNKDKEIVNSKGVAVDMMTLAGLEDPYGPEIRRRTEGMSTEDELLEFLRGLNGQWGSRRRKKRVVDASDFGDALPKGWKISLSIKRKEGRVWLFCRRYISPSGRQFESCKDVSTYLLSILGDKNLDKLNHANSNICDGALKAASGNAANLVLPEDKRDDPVYAPSAPSSSLPMHCEKPVSLDIGDQINVKAGELFKCLKCTMIFEGKDDLYDHQLSVHNRDRSQVDGATTDAVIVNGGIYECKFCHMSFNERNQYNDHIGTHVKNEIENTEASPIVTTEEVVDSVSLSGVPDKELLASVTEEGNIVGETCEEHISVELKYASSHSNHKSSGTETNTDTLVRDLNVLSHEKQDAKVNFEGNSLEGSFDKPDKYCVRDDDEVHGIDGAPDVAVSTSDTFVGHEAAVSTETDGKAETSDEAHLGGVDNKLEAVLEQRSSSGSCLLSQRPNEQMCGATGVGKAIVGISASVEVLNQNAVSEPAVHTSSIPEMKDSGANMDDTHVSSMSEELTSEKEKVVNSEPSSDFFSSRVGLDEDRENDVKKLSTSESHFPVPSSTDAFNALNSASLRASPKEESAWKGGSLSNVAAPSTDKDTHGFDSNLNRFSSCLASSELDGQYEVGSSAFDSYAASGMEGVSTFEGDNNLKSSSVSSWQEEECGNEKVGSKVSMSALEESRMPANSEQQLPLSDCEQNCDMENNVEKLSSSKSERAKLDEFQVFRNNEPINNQSVASLSNNQNVLNTGVLAFNTEKNLEFCSLVPSGNEQAFGFQDDITGLYDSAMEECKEGSSERGLLNQFCIAETSDDFFGNKIYSTPLDGLKFDEDRDIGSHELSLSFGNCSSVPSKNEETFDVQTNLSMVNNSMVGDLKGGRESMGGLFSLSCNNGTSGYQSNANTVYPSREWEGIKSDEFRNPESKKFLFGFGSNQDQRNEEVVPCGMWRTGERNQLQSGLANHPQAQIQSPSCFHSFDIMSEKADDGLFRLGERYNDGAGVSGLRSGRSEPVEFSFLTGRPEHNPNALQHNPNALQGDSRVFSYNTEMEQEFDPSFWLRKNALMPNIAGRNQVTSVCIWCRNEFHLQPIHSGTQAGIGSICPACAAGYAEQVNML